MRVAEIINRKLSESLSPTTLSIVDDSHKHAGHAGATPGGESHFSITIVSKNFEGKSRIQRQRMVYKALSEEMAGRIHALALQTLTPSELK
ncbi:MAG: BolA family transcriptional regulator [Magnetovibrio sp.]|nr:BolA family transcriptional regulator [Magnetovibrio sp.]|tara:strand:+ start:540 stop:812 length:273 start_codon:yes stop_codon:yes gene_type:complete